MNNSINPILSSLLNQNVSSQQNNSIQNMMNMLKGTSNPKAMLQQMLMNHPKYQQIMKYIQMNNGDYKKAFYKMAEDQGIDPNSILGQLNNI